VRDFAYPSFHPLHYGPSPPGLSGLSTPASDNAHRRLSDPAPGWDAARGDWKSGTWDTDPLPNTSYSDKDGPPWSEDEDVASPVVTASRHRKIKSSIPSFDDSRAHSSANGRASTGYAPNAPERTSAREGLGPQGRGDARFLGATLSNRAYDKAGSGGYHEYDSDDDAKDDPRYSRDYQFTIVSPDEEMHGRAVALFDFEAENENELSMREGMIVFISFRHGQGWLVAQDLKSGESGLVPEEYVRLLRDIEGGYDGLMMTNGEPDEARTPTQETTSMPHDHVHPQKEPGQNFQPVVSTFSITREDLEPFPTHKLNSPTTATPTETNRKGLDETLSKEEKPSD
jgi:SH3 domain